MILDNETDGNTLEDDLNYIRTDRKLIKGTTNCYDNLPTYEKPNAIGTDINVNLTNIADKTTDVRVFIFRRTLNNVVTSNSTYITVTKLLIDRRH
jgi:hypothetical protein